MKKVFSFLAIAAMVVGVTSAFKTAPVKDGSASYQAWYVKQNTYSGAISNATADANKRGSASLHTESVQFEVNPYGTCAPDPTFICVVEIKYQDGLPAAGNIVDFRLGDSPFTS